MNAPQLQRASKGSANGVGIVDLATPKKAVKTSTLHLPESYALRPQAARGDDDLMSQPQVRS
jgi:hypothetical protein